MSYGNIVLANSKVDFIPRVIKWLTKSNWSHSLITTRPVDGKEMGIEAAMNGISDILFDAHYRQDPTQGYKVYRLNVSDEIKDAALLIVSEDLEKPYGFLDLPWFFWRAFNRMLGRDIKSQNNWASKNEICSQLVVKYLTACKLGQIFAGYGVNAIAPQDLDDIMTANPQYFEVIETKE